MTKDEFQQLLEQDPALRGPISAAARAGGGPGTRSAFGVGVTEAAVVALMFPVASYIVREIGLPWLYEAKRYTEIWRLKFHDWIDGKYGEHGLDPDQAEAAGEALRKQLEEITGADDKASWERFLDLLKQVKSD